MATIPIPKPKKVSEPITVGQLIRKLAKMDQDLPVFFADYDDDSDECTTWNKVVGAEAMNVKRKKLCSLYHTSTVDQ